MTTEQLLEFCVLPDTKKNREYVEGRRALFEKMQEVCDWDKGLCPLPDGVMVDTKMPRTGLQIRRVLAMSDQTKILIAAYAAGVVVAVVGWWSVTNAIAPF